MNEDRNGNRRVSGFLKRNGVFLALAVSVLLVGAVVISGVTQKLSKPTNEEDLNSQQQVEQTVTGQKDTRTHTTTTTITTTNRTTTTSIEEVSLYLLPLTNTVQKVFSSEGPMYSETMKDWRLHLGVDFAGEEGQEVTAVTGGTIISVKEDPMWGGVIEIDHGVGVVTRYCGVKTIVKNGDVVEMGEHIGDLQTIPCECAQPPHLHLEMIVDGKPIDPVAAIGLDVRYADTTK